MAELTDDDIFEKVARMTFSLQHLLTQLSNVNVMVYEAIYLAQENNNNVPEAVIELQRFAETTEVLKVEIVENMHKVIETCQHHVEARLIQLKSNLERKRSGVARRVEQRLARASIDLKAPMPGFLKVIANSNEIDERQNIKIEVESKDEEETESLAQKRRTVRVVKNSDQRNAGVTNADSVNDENVNSINLVTGRRAAFKRRFPKSVYCICKRGDYGEMIACDNSSCEFQWFHYGCIGMKTPPTGDWYCPACSVINVDD